MCVCVCARACMRARVCMCVCARRARCGVVCVSESARVLVCVCVCVQLVVRARFVCWKRPMCRGGRARVQTGVRK